MKFIIALCLATLLAACSPAQFEPAKAGETPDQCMKREIRNGNNVGQMTGFDVSKDSPSDFIELARLSCMAQ